MKLMFRKGGNWKWNCSASTELDLQFNLGIVVQVLQPLPTTCEVADIDLLVAVAKPPRSNLLKIIYEDALCTAYIAQSEFCEALELSRSLNVGPPSSLISEERILISAYP